MIPHNQIVNHRRQDPRISILSVRWLPSKLQRSIITCDRELIKVKQPTFELRAYVTVGFLRINPRSTVTPTQITRQIFPSPFLVTSLRFNFTNIPPFDRQCRNRTFLNALSGLEYEITHQTYNRLLWKSNFLLTSNWLHNHFWKLRSTWWFLE